MKLVVALLAIVSTATGFKLAPLKTPKATLAKASAAITSLSINAYVEAAHAKSIMGVNGALDFGPLAGDQPGGEGTGKALGINDDSLLFVLGGVFGSVFFAFAQWQDKQDDDEDFFDTYDSRRVEIGDNRNRGRQGDNDGEVFGRKA